ncbi:MAG: hypothetical protein ACLTL2_20510, partial [Blautia sp.]
IVKLIKSAVVDKTAETQGCFHILALNIQVYIVYYGVRNSVNLHVSLKRNIMNSRESHCAKSSSGMLSFLRSKQKWSYMIHLDQQPPAAAFKEE